MLNIENKTALVTGANRGIGKTITETFLNKGASKVYVGVRELSKAQALVDQYGDRVEAIEIDLAKPETITAAANHAQDVDVVVNNAGVLKTATPLASDALDSLNYEMEMNVWWFDTYGASICTCLKKEWWWSISTT